MLKLHIGRIKTISFFKPKAGKVLERETVAVTLHRQLPLAESGQLVTDVRPRAAAGALNNVGMHVLLVREFTAGSSLQALKESVHGWNTGSDPSPRYLLPLEGLTNSSCTMPLLYSSMVGNVVLRQIYRKSHGKTCLLQDTLKRSMMFLLQAEHSNSHIQPCKT